MNTPNRLWVILQEDPTEVKPVIYGTYRSGQEAEAALKILRGSWPSVPFVLASYLRDGSLWP